MAVTRHEEQKSFKEVFDNLYDSFSHHPLFRWELSIIDIAVIAFILYA